MSNLSGKYRPLSFSDVVGQENIINPLQAEIKQNKLGHAYLFSGPRGVGKTTIARIFAKAVNCQNPQNGEPCLKCESCLKIANQQAIDIIEMDAASNNGVEHVRNNIVEHVRFVPASLKYKVYILDEAHMLTTQAWNALLKTIEEPPEYAIFIFATTEKHKIPATIISRCQRFDFNRIENNKLKERLSFLIKSEDLNIENNVLDRIISLSEGCLRDAENLLGQLIGLGEKNITDSIADLILPRSDNGLAIKLLKYAFQKQTTQLLELIIQAEKDGLDFTYLFNDLIYILREVSHVQHLPTLAQQKLKGTNEDQQIVELVKFTNHQEVLNSTLIILSRRQEAKQGLDARFALELALMAIALGIAQQANESYPLAQNPISSTDKDKEAKSLNRPEANFQKKQPMVNNNHSSLSDTEDSVATIKKKEQSAKKQEVKSQNINQMSVFSIWQKLLQELDNDKALFTILKSCQPISLENNVLKIKFQYSLHKKKIIDDTQRKQTIEDCLCKILNQNNIVIEPGEENNSNNQNDSSVVEEKDTVRKILDAFGGQVITNN